MSFNASKTEAFSFSLVNILPTFYRFMWVTTAYTTSSDFARPRFQDLEWNKHVFPRLVSCPKTKRLPFRARKCISPLFSIFLISGIYGKFAYGAWTYTTSNYLAMGQGSTFLCEVPVLKIQVCSGCPYVSTANILMIHTLTKSLPLFHPS